jgi:hypothetical protein
LIAIEKTLPWRRVATYGTTIVLVVLGVLMLVAPRRFPGSRSRARPRCPRCRRWGRELPPANRKGLQAVTRRDYESRYGRAVFDSSARIGPKDSGRQPSSAAH